MTRQKHFLVFDVNETLLDLRVLDRTFAEIFGDTSARQEWFNLLLQSAFAANSTGRYRDFRALGRSALKIVAIKRSHALSDAEIARVLEGISQLTPHPEVADSLARLSDGGFVLTALTQSPQATLEAQLTNSGLRRFFSRSFSADQVKRYKPAPEPYRFVAREMGCATADLRLVAAHGWDIEGAMSAGCMAAFVARPGQVLDPDVPQPDVIGATLAEIADRLLQNA